jgi:CrcB protein
MLPPMAAPFETGREAERPPFMKEIAAIALGGAIGACMRFGVSVAVAAAELHAALGAGIANIVGSFLLGVLVGHLDSGRAHPLLRPFLTVGVFGSFTTFSALALDNRGLASEGGEGLALAHLIGTIVVGLAAFAFGNVLDGLFEGGDRRNRA